MDKFIDSLGRAKLFSTSDAHSGYLQIQIKPEDRLETSFTFHEGTYQCIRIPFGLTNAPPTVQRPLDLILSRFSCKHFLIYLDDVIIYSNSIEEHIDHVDEILTALTEACVTLMINKCSFFSDTVEYPGNIIRPGTLEVSKFKTKSLREARPPTKKTEVHSLLDLSNVYRRFINGFTNIFAQLNKLLQNNTPDSFKMEEEHLNSFHKFIDVVSSSPILAFLHPDLSQSMDTDAIKHVIGVMLFQNPRDGTRRPIGYW